ncbi:UNVERIFIED_ORG: hypothetical protein FHR35_000765 [Microbispora rosea subsp. rosea]
MTVRGRVDAPSDAAKAPADAPHAVGRDAHRHPPNG